MRQHIGEVEAVPYIIELTDNEAEHEEQEQRAAEYAFTFFDLGTEEEQDRLEDYKETILDSSHIVIDDYEIDDVGEYEWKDLLY